MPKQQILTAIDFGSSQINSVAAIFNEQKATNEILTGVCEHCKGIKGGVVVNIEETARSITRCIENIEDQLKTTIKEVYIGIRGTHIQSMNHHGAIPISRTDKEISAEDVTNVLEAAKAVPISHDREIIHVIPLSFTIDKQQGIPNPVGMEGNLLEVDVHIVTASLTHLNNIWKSVNRAGFVALGPVYGLLAVSESVITQEEKDLGCLLLDIGGQTTGIAIWYDGCIRYSKELQIGGDDITMDIARGLGTSFSQAKLIKEKYGAVFENLLPEQIKTTETTFFGVDGRTIKKLDYHRLTEVIQPRVEEIFNYILNELHASGYSDLITYAGCILTGGSAHLKGIPEAAQQILGIPARLGLPREVIGKEEIINNLNFVTAIGILKENLLEKWVAKGSKKISFLKKFLGISH